MTQQNISIKKINMVLVDKSNKLQFFKGRQPDAFKVNHWQKLTFKTFKKQGLMHASY